MTDVLMRTHSRATAPTRRLLSMSTTALGGELPAKLGAVAAAGFDAVELFDEDTAPDGPSAARRALAEAGLSPLLYQPLRDIEGLPETRFEAALGRALAFLDTAAEIGAPAVLVCSNTADDALDDPARAAAQLHRLATAAHARGLGLVYEALSWGRHVRTWRRAWSLVRAVDHPALKLGLDSFHTLALCDEVAGLSQLPGDRIGFVQLADAPWSTLDARGWSRTLRAFPGEGEFDVAGFTRAALASGYAGPLSLEVFNPAIRALPPETAARLAKAALDALLADVGSKP